MKRRPFLFLTLASLALLVNHPHPLSALSGRGVRDIAERITVQIQGASSPGSGVMLYRDRNKYFVLTAKHVIESTQEDEEAYVRTHDGQSHPITLANILYLSGVDIALVSFKSDRDYDLALVGQSQQLVETDTVYVAGFPLPGQAITQSTFTITKGVLSGRGNYDRGYELVYDSVTQAGMSGGPVLNTSGQLVGIHGLAEGERVGDVPVKAGFNLGIPTHSILGLIPIPIQTAAASEVVESNPAPNALSSEQDLRQELDRYYAALPNLIEARDAQRIFDYMPIQKDIFRYIKRDGEVQTYNSRIVGATKYYRKSLARRESWQVRYDQIEVEMTQSDAAQVTHIETVKWSLWPGLIRGVAKRQETYQWQKIAGNWWIVSGSETVL